MPHYFTQQSFALAPLHIVRAAIAAVDEQQARTVAANSDAIAILTANYVQSQSSKRLPLRVSDFNPYRGWLDRLEARRRIPDRGARIARELVKADELPGWAAFQLWDWRRELQLAAGDED